VHLPKHVEADEPVTVTARITPQQAAQAPTGAQPGKDGVAALKRDGHPHQRRREDQRHDQNDTGVRRPQYR